MTTTGRERPGGRSGRRIPALGLPHPGRHPLRRHARHMARGRHHQLRRVPQPRRHRNRRVDRPTPGESDHPASGVPIRRVQRASMQLVSRLHRQLPDSATHTVPGAGHAAWSGVPDAFPETASCPTTQPTPAQPAASETELQATAARRCRGQTSMVTAAPSARPGSTTTTSSPVFPPVNLSGVVSPWCWQANATLVLDAVMPYPRHVRTVPIQS